MEAAKGFGEFQASRVRGDFLEDAERTDPLVIEFLHRPLGLDIACVKPAKVAWFKVRNFLAAVLSRGLVTIDRDLELVAKIFVESLEGDGCLGSFD